MTDIRPISLCNVIYKIGSKVIANRLKVVLPSIISPTQSAFMPKRLITDNVLLAFELNHHINCKPKGKVNFMTLKLDVSKAYDRVEWSFLRKSLLRLGLDSSFVNLIMNCVTSVNYSFLMNGSQFGVLQPGRRLRQGDPLSPYLFICVVESFIALISEAERRGEISGVRVARNTPSITTLCFADETLLFCKATEGEAVALKTRLDLYANVSGQVINYEKSSMTFSRGISQAKRGHIIAILGVAVVAKHEKYLGMPAVLGRSKKEIFGALRERIWSKIIGWGEQTLSSAGREIMIKAVLQSIPSYLMSCFLVPKNIIYLLESAIRISGGVVVQGRKWRGFHGKGCANQNRKATWDFGTCVALTSPFSPSKGGGY